MNQTTKICSSCGQEIIEETIILNVAKLELLTEYYLEEDGPYKGDQANIAQLKYWKLIRLRGNLWEITEIGRLYLKGMLKLHTVAVVVGGKVKRMEGPELSIKALLPDYEYKED